MVPWYGPTVDEELPADATGPLQIVGVPLGLKLRIRLAADRAGVSMSRYLIQHLGDTVPEINEGQHQ
jgi:hypothetical protein